MAVHVFSQKMKNFYTIAIYFNTTRDIYFGHVLRCFRRKRNMFLSNDNGYMHISLSVDRLDMYFIFSLLNMSIPNRVTIFPWCPATSIQLILHSLVLVCMCHPNEMFSVAQRNS